MQAADVARDIAAYQRSSLEAHRAYFAAASKLVEARGQCRRGEWGEFLRWAGLESRTAQNMMVLARHGFTADELTEYGGILGALESLRALAKAGTVDAEPETEKTETVSGFSQPDAVGYVSVVPVGAAEGLPERATGGEGILARSGYRHPDGSWEP